MLIFCHVVRISMARDYYVLMYDTITRYVEYIEKMMHHTDVTPHNHMVILCNLTLISVPLFSVNRYWITFSIVLTILFLLR